MSKPQPQALSSAEAAGITARNIGTYRQLDCAFYDHCLIIACKGRWASFHCKSCQAYTPAKPLRVEDFLTRLEETYGEDNH